MAEEQNQDVAAEEQQPQAQFQLQKLYLKDASFELPNAPQIFQDDGQVEIKLNLAQKVENLAEGVKEVMLTVTVTATIGEKTAYLAEAQQAGIFAIAGLNEQSEHAAINTLCPHTLFPYARRVITDMVADGGFPPLVLQPINFDQIYAQRLQEAQAQGNGAENMDVQGNA
ncbi:MAG: protein-export chaperone SecB [Xanthomonadales bacterium]|nr:protein-export chaperone SecB [Gammaproteobacteria bacterium]MBT8072386.1 protein-export chaperone SecB [Gammaproteobacteria bacterium]MBT8076130.1 protein-export chaperone SecB [Gammaproteobacteria bacterium]NNK03226.1 protein-export chaperone SecB [Xanthomonadales bacterium]NNK97788.1 protein-export chaperone SecB [Xanthomonadales bacterium]